MTWLPIETAPKDGTPVLLGYSDTRGKFAARSAKWAENTIFPARGKLYPAWVCTMDPHLVDQRATHWMSLEPLSVEASAVTSKEG